LRGLQGNAQAGRNAAAHSLRFSRQAFVDALALFWHLANFVAPALGVGMLSAALCKAFWRKSLARTPWTTLAWQSSLAGLVVLVAGLVVTQHDGKMVTYAALVVACALVPWFRAHK
jgi:hypothetical protein